MSGAAGGVDDDIATRVFKCKVCGKVKDSEYKINHHTSYRVDSSETSHVDSEYVRRQTMLLRRRRQILNELADGEVSLNDYHVIIRTSVVLEIRRPQHRADPVGETRRVGEGEMNSRNFV